MRLLHTQNQVFASFDGESVPPYAILSHTWGSEEVTYQDMVAWISREEKCSIHQKRGFFKIERACHQAFHDGLEWVWIDTCNIDKSSSSELSEAINSMFQWYRNAAVCYVYLEDIKYDDLEPSEGVARYKLEVLRSARWFSRGWTLQELIASEKINFFCTVPENTQWWFIGSKETESKYLAAITGIDRAVLEDPDLLPTVSVARRMSWAARRQTTRPEDIAYCLLGVFQVNMPLLYGEGANAFIRLQEEILKDSEDESLFAWTEPEASINRQQNDGILATHPRAFSESSQIVPYASKLEPYAMTNRGLRIESRFIPFIDSNSSYRQSISCILHCRYESTFESSISIAIEMDTSTGRYRRSRDRNLRTLRTISNDIAKIASTRTIYIHKCGPFRTRALRQCHISNYPTSNGFKLEAAIASQIEHAIPIGGLLLNGTPEYAPGKVKIPWSLKHRALIAPATTHGYFSALWFSRASSGDRRSNSEGFIALMILPNKVEDFDTAPPPGVFLTPLMKTPNRSELHLPLETGFKKIESCESTLDLGDGIVVASLTLEDQFGDDTFVLDIVFKHTASHATAEPQSLKVVPPPEIKVFDSQNQDITLFGHENLGVSGSSQTPQSCGLLRLPTD
ncbi:unnamed protein product [Periconia digitata]|uniref:Heterokaryon incompatibility domain-containing protein n=1 Tax=Periconia digitata TaxID=1303443 RepID=A0A9W4U183_9PLEO|nr:unnamed protein product [Periconia digitata]